LLKLESIKTTTITLSSIDRHRGTVNKKISNKYLEILYKYTRQI